MAFEVPPVVIINELRDEVARLNDERLSLKSQLTFAENVIAALQHQLEHEAGTDHVHDADETIDAELVEAQDDTSIE